LGEGIDLWLEREPAVQEVLEDIERYDLSKYREVVFCGYGEPMTRTYDIVEISRRLKAKYDIRIRINTNGHANLIYGKDITPLLKGLIDSISISLNAKNAVEYQKICQSDYGEDAYYGMLDFAAKCKKYIPEVILTVVDVMPQEDIKKCENIAREIGVTFRVRHYSG
jgi:TatD family-associated radical SAM protein